ncbi:histone H2B type 1-A-like [Hippopotamus amphibius kiboko]|uniref:histone H2B type 1-A-like n=1 Tax=Hippopotamus amphibius kiboko TaxID=575201 RepID=UPI0025918936|nr:histone H2B type 1-A-like [Hippopotamus amphibius kiboko]
MTDQLEKNERRECNDPGHQVATTNHAELSLKGPTISKKGFNKAVTKTQKKEGKECKRCRKVSYSIYIYEVLKQVHPDNGIKAISIMNFFVTDIFKHIAGEVLLLASYNKDSIIASGEIQMAMCLLLPRELAKHAMTKGTTAVPKYTSSK